MKYFFSIFLVLFLLQFQVNAATKSGSFDKTELEALVNERWGAIINHKFGDSYKYETPAYKEVFTKDLYVSQFSYGVDWSLTKIVDIKYDPATNVAVVSVLVETKPKNSKGLDAAAKTVAVEIHEKWLHIKGRWWHSSSE